MYIYVFNIIFASNTLFMALNLYIYKTLWMLVGILRQIIM